MSNISLIILPARRRNANIATAPKLVPKAPRRIYRWIKFTYPFKTCVTADLFKLELTVDTLPIAEKTSHSTFSSVLSTVPAFTISMKYNPEKTPIYGESLESLQAYLEQIGQPKFRAKQILDWLYKKRARSWDAMSNIPKPLREQLEIEF